MISTNAKKNKPSPAPVPVTPIVGSLPLAVSKWTSISTPNPFPWSNDAAGALAFTFPGQSGLMNYAYYKTGVKGSVSGAIAADISIRTMSGSPVWHFDLNQPAGCSTPPTVMIFVWSNDLLWGEFDRWWAFADAYTLKNGDATVRAPKDPARWSSVYGKKGSEAPANFAAAFDNVSAIGMTFGGGCFYGHGVFTSDGSAEMKVRSVRVEN